jgi:hypothetical protein
MVRNSALQIASVRGGNLEDKVNYLLDYITITDLVQRYGQAIDMHDFDLLRSCYGHEIEVDHSPTIGMGLMRISADKWCDLAKQFHSQLDGDEHILIPQEIIINGDKASCHVLMHARHFYRKANGTPYQSLVGTYDLDLERLENGWKIAKSVQGVRWAEGNWQFHEDIKNSFGNPGLS